MTLVGRAKLCRVCKAALTARLGRDVETAATYLWWACPHGHRQGDPVELPAALAEQAWKS